ncbi:MAG: acylphosphatase [Clostridiales bacterium]|nr:acylphosphatase [Clostridiales bacterium]
MENATHRAHVWVSGRVQGVCFRAATNAEAVRLGVSGWVRNLPDGRVEAVLEGSPEAVAAAIEWCRTGPPRAAVASVEVIAEDPEGLSGFGSGPPL